MIDWSRSFDDVRWRTLSSNVCMLDSHVELLLAHHPTTALAADAELGYSMAVRFAASEAYFATMGRIMERNHAQASLWSAMQSARQPTPMRWRQLEDSWHGTDTRVGQVKYRHNVVAHANHETSAAHLSAQLPRTKMNELCDIVNDTRFCFAWIAKALTGQEWQVARHNGELVKTWRRLTGASTAP